MQTPLKKEIIEDVLPLFHQTAPAEMKLDEVLKVKQSLMKTAGDPEFARSMRNSLLTYIKELDKTLEQVRNPAFAQPFSEIERFRRCVKNYKCSIRLCKEAFEIKVQFTVNLRNCGACYNTSYWITTFRNLLVLWVYRLSL